MNEPNNVMMGIIKELVAIGICGIAHCQPWLKHQIHPDLEIEKHYPVDWDFNNFYLYNS